MVAISIECADGRPLSALTDLIKARAKWMDETAEQSVTATLLDVLVSLRAQTKVAKPRREEIDMQPTNLAVSFTGGRQNPRVCLRHGPKGARYTPKPKERMAQLKGIPTKELKRCKVFKWVDIKDRVWLVIARSQSEAASWALNKVKKRA